jgi:hypothetical protein
MPATATDDSHYCTCLGHLGRYDTDRIVSIYVMLPKVAKEVGDCHVSRSLSPGLSRNLRQWKHDLRNKKRFLMPTPCNDDHSDVFDENDDIDLVSKLYKLFHSSQTLTENKLEHLFLA